MYFIIQENINNILIANSKIEDLKYKKDKFLEKFDDKKL